MEANRKLPFRGIKMNLYRFYKISICNRCYFDMKQKYVFNFNFQNKRIKIDGVIAFCCNKQSFFLVYPRFSNGIRSDRKPTR